MKYSIENSAKLVNLKHYSLYVNGLYTSNTRNCQNKYLQSLIKAHVVEDTTIYVHLECHCDMTEI